MLAEDQHTVQNERRYALSPLSPCSLCDMIDRGWITDFLNGLLCSTLLDSVPSVCLSLEPVDLDGR